MRCRDTLEAIETAVEDEGALRRLARQVAADEDLTADERDQLRGRIEFYLGDMHLKLKVPGLLFSPSKGSDVPDRPRRRAKSLRTRPVTAGGRPLLPVDGLRE